MPNPDPRHLRPAGRARALVHGLAWACADAIQKASNACLYIAAGVLRRDELQAASREQSLGFSTSADDVDAGLATEERQFYTRFLQPADRVLVVGCGAGRELLALCSMGYQVTGLDQTPEIIEVARAHLFRRGMTVPLQVAAIETAELDGRYDAMIFSNGCYSFIQGSERRVETLRRLKAHLSPGGRVFFSYYPFRRQSRIGHWLTRVSARLSGADWSPELGDVFSRDTFAHGTLRYRHDFAPDPFARECAAAGLTVSADEPLDEVLRFALAVPI